MYLRNKIFTIIKEDLNNIIMLNSNNIKGVKLGNNKNTIQGVKSANNLKSNFINKNQKHLYN
jgi:hypothetical protein